MTTKHETEGEEQKLDPTQVESGKDEASEVAAEHAAAPESEAGEAGPSIETEDSEADGEELDPLTALEAERDAAVKEAAVNYERFVRARAEIDNIQKRQKRELADRARYAVEPLARDLLGALDDLERALAHTETGDAFVEGVALVSKNLQAALDSNGVKRLECLGQPFDPALHEAVTMVPAEGREAGVVAEEHRAGYLLHDRLLRAALVAVTEG